MLPLMGYAIYRCILPASVIASHPKRQRVLFTTETVGHGDLVQRSPPIDETQ